MILQTHQELITEIRKFLKEKGMKASTHEELLKMISVFLEDKIVAPTHAELINTVESFLVTNDMKAHEFGKQHLNDSGALPRLKSGSDPRLSTVLKIIKVITGK